MIASRPGDSTDLTPGGRRRRRSSSSRRTSGWPALYRDWMARAMVVVTIVVALGTIVVLRGQLSAYADVVAGWHRSDLVYGFGKPVAESARDGRTTLLHKRGDLLVASTLGQNGVERVLCSPDQGAATCPPIAGIGGGDAEETVWRRLGAPTRIRYIGSDKLLDYDGLGLTFKLRRFVVREIELRPIGGMLPFLGRWAIATLP